MSSLVYYLLQVIVCSGILYLYYWAFLRNKRFHQYNRFYLLGTVILSIIIPFLRIPVYFTHEETNSSIVVRTLTILSPYSEVNAGNTAGGQSSPGFIIFSINLIYCFYALIAGMALVRIALALLRIKRLGNRNPVEQLGSIKFVNTNDSHAPFSFFNWLFWNREIELKSEKGEQVFRHELFHIREKHSVDIVFLELVTMIFWINPFFHLIKKETRAIHEFLADQYALSKGEQWNYAETLLMHALQTKHSLVNPFFNNQIKRRIAMIMNPQKTSHQYLRKMLVLPVATVIITLFAFSYRKDHRLSSVQRAETPITVIIDAGHGGIDPGVYSPGKLHNESDITLSLAKLIQRLAPEYNIKAVLTREDANLPGGATNKNDGLRNRIELTNVIKPEVFVSLHMNYLAGKQDAFQDKYSGIEAYVTNKREDNSGKVAASAILEELSTIYKTSTDLKFRESNGIYVLDNANCATVLLECGYINNRKDLEFITSSDKQEKLARGILRGIIAYRKNQRTMPTGSVNLKDSIPGAYNIVSLDIKFAEDFSLKGENINMHIPEGSLKKESKFGLIVFNGELFTLDQAKKKLNNVIIKSADISIIPANDKDAIAKYGDRATNGVMVIKDATVIKRNLTQLSGKVAVQVPGNKEKNHEGNLVIKGVQAEPLIIVDGKELPSSPEGDETAKRLDHLDPNTIESITVLKDESATSIYGEKGKNGVILITTKKKSGDKIEPDRKDSAVITVVGYGQKPSNAENNTKTQ